MLNVVDTAASIFPSCSDCPSLEHPLSLDSSFDAMDNLRTLSRRQDNGDRLAIRYEPSISVPLCILDPSTLGDSGIDTVVDGAFWSAAFVGGNESLRSFISFALEASNNDRIGAVFCRFEPIGGSRLLVFAPAASHGAKHDDGVLVATSFFKEGHEDANFLTFRGHFSTDRSSVATGEVSAVSKCCFTGDDTAAAATAARFRLLQLTATACPAVWPLRRFFSFDGRLILLPLLLLLLLHPSPLSSLFCLIMTMNDTSGVGP